MAYNSVIMAPWLETGGILMDQKSAHMILPHAARNSNGLSFKEVAPQKLYNEMLFTYLVHTQNMPIGWH